MGPRVSSLPALQLSVVLLAFAPRGWAATSALCDPGWEWANNSLGQNPCQIAGALQAQCLGYDTYALSPLNPGTVYTPPGTGNTKGLECGCNTVIYSLYSACEACQNATTISWNKWDSNCDYISVSQYPFEVPGDTAIPQWAFINVTTEGTFDPNAAQNVGRDPEAVGNVPVTLSLSSTPSPGKPFSLPASSFSSSAVFSSSPDPFSTGGPDANGDSVSSSDRVPAIVGGVIGGLVGLAALLLLLTWLYLRRPSNGPLPPATGGPLSRHSLSFTGRGSYYPPSVPAAYGPEPEMDETSLRTPMRRPDVPSQESGSNNHDSRSIISSTEFDVQTTYDAPLSTGGREHTGGRLAV